MSSVANCTDYLQPPPITPLRHTQSSALIKILHNLPAYNIAAIIV